MKCPKCGSENVLVEKSIDGFNTCEQCGYRWQRARNIPEPTTAEMLLWLFRNTNFRIINGQELGFYIDEIWHGFDFYGHLKSEAIKQAYDWARKEEAK